jgi:L-ascorbate metabolism protein UlaG (beta-lactamase superfamily)
MKKNWLSVARTLALFAFGSSLSLGVAGPLQAESPKPAQVFLTWMSVTNWLFEVGNIRIVMDGYISRIPQEAFSGLSFATAVPSRPDEPAIRRVVEAVGNAGKINFILTGHSHFDHSFDTAVWAKLTGAQIIGSRSTCLQAIAQNVPSSQCTAVEGGEVLSLGDHITVRVVRWNHSGEVSSPAGRMLYTPFELVEKPTMSSEGLRPGVLQDFPNGGGARAYLFTVETTEGVVSWLYSNTGNADTFQRPAPMDEAFFQAQGVPLNNLVFSPQQTSSQDNLRAAMTAAKLDHVDLWTGYSDRSLAEAVCSILRPKAHIPHHWDGLFSPFFSGLQFSYPSIAGTSELIAFFQSQGVTPLPPQQYMDKFQLTIKGMTLIANDAIKAKLGFSNIGPAALDGRHSQIVVHSD